MKNKFLRIILIIMSLHFKNVIAQGQIKQNIVTNANWSVRSIAYDSSKKNIVVSSVGIKKVSRNIIRTVYIKINEDTNSHTFYLTLDKRSYFDIKNHIQMTGYEDKYIDTFQILELLKDFEGAIRPRISSGNIPDSLQVDTLKLNIYNQSLLVYDPNPDIEDVNNSRKIIFIPNITIGAAYSSISVDTAYFAKPDELTKREQTQRRTIGYNYGIGIGFRPYRSHIIFIEGFYNMMGFESENYTIDWQTGFLSNPNSTSTKYIFKNLSVGIGYLCAPIPPKGAKLGYLIQAEVYYSLNTGNVYYAKGYENTKSSIYIKKDRFGAKFGLGGTYKFNDCLSLKILPIYQWDFDSVNKGQLGTRLKLLGLNTGLIISF